ncbi:hypothetical protein ACFC18_51740 [Streptomyces sp. NPDC056121]|uniref:hypothetical protein n=1 Tax=Streptomyces sp. NPDC056121 TaxID=3345718 RepID=UPI0035DF470A
MILSDRPFALIAAVPHTSDDLAMGPRHLLRARGEQDEQDDQSEQVVPRGDRVREGMFDAPVVRGDVITRVEATPGQSRSTGLAAGAKQPRESRDGVLP